MSVAIVTGSAGLIGSEASRHFAGLGLDVVGIRDTDAIDAIFAEYGKHVSVVIHTAAQPSHDWAAREPHTDFSVNALGTLNLLQAVRESKPEATFIFTSTNKVYGDRPNYLPLEDTGTRLELPEDHEYFGGIPTSMSIDTRCTRS